MFLNEFLTLCVPTCFVSVYTHDSCIIKSNVAYYVKHCIKRPYKVKYFYSEGDEVIIYVE